METFARLWTQTVKNWRLPVFALAVAAGLAMSCPVARAQSGAGSIQGTVTDATGAVIPSASIHVLNQATGVALDTKANGVGFYQVPGLFTGTYVVSVNAAGMKTSVQTIELLVAQNAVVNIALAPGAVTQQVEVSANTIQLTTTDNGAISSTLENTRINQLPMNGRNLITLTSQTTPGLESCSQSSSCPNGLMGQAMEYVADGASLANREFGGTHTGASQMPDPDSVQEVHVETTGSGAQFATPATAVLTTKSGTNSLHGSFFETARNNYFGIARSRSNPSNYVAPPYIRNEFGASAGGPIILPHLYHGKDKSFWFFAYERYSLRSLSYINMKVPTVAMRSGDFSGLINSSNNLQQLYNPATTAPSNTCTLRNGTVTKSNYCRQPFAGNVITGYAESPTAKVINDITALPTNSNNPLTSNNLSGPSPNNTTIPNITFRLDHEFSESNRAYLRYTSSKTSNLFLRNDPSNAAPTLAADGLPAAASNVSINTDVLYAGAIGYTHVFSPTFFSETVASQSWFGEFNGAAGTPLANFEQKLGLPNNFGEGGFPYFESIISPLDGTQFQYSVTSIISTLDENLTKTVGKHQMMFGGRYRHERFGSRPDQIKDTINFNGNGTGLEDPTKDATLAFSKLSNTGYADGDFYIGSASAYGVNIEPPYQHMHDMEFDAYYQDYWHVRRDLTVNLGLRYEAHPAIWSKYGIMEGFDLKNHAIVTGAPTSTLIAEGYTTQAIVNNDIYDGAKFETASDAGMPANTLTNNDDFTFGPRVGIAYQPFGGKYGTVLRGAYGRYIYPEPLRNFMVSVGRSNPFTAGYSMNYNSANQAPDGKTNWAIRNPQSVVMGQNSANVVNSTSTNSILPGIGITSLDPDFPSTYVTQTNFTVEQPLKGNSALRVSYMYTHGQNLAQNYDYNTHPSTYVWELMTGTIPPQGSTVGSNQYSATATGPYDQTTYGSGMAQIQKSGWSNDHILQANYQRLFHHGYAYQISYAWSKPFRIGSNSSRDSTIAPYLNYTNSGLGVVTPYVASPGGTTSVLAPTLPPPPPAGTASYGYYRGLNRFQNYMVDTAVPLQHIQFNGIVDLPFGRGKKILGNANRLLNELVGGYQLAGSGSVTSQDFTVSSYWGAHNPIKMYKNSAPITDCRSGNCYKVHEWFNGYIAPTALSGNTCSAGFSTVVSGLPSNWTPYAEPSDLGCSAPTVVKGVLTTTPDQYFGSDYINMQTTDGKVAALAYSPGSQGSNPNDKTVLNGPFNWTADASIFKVFPITERTNLRFNMDAFNVFNVQGMNNPSGTDGTVGTVPGGVGYSSHNTPRQIQFTLRLSF